MSSLLERFGSCLKFGDPAARVYGPLSGTIGIMGDDRPATSEFRGRQLFLVFVLALLALVPTVHAFALVAEVELPEGLHKFAISTGRHGEYELEITPEIVRRRLKIVDVFIFDARVKTPSCVYERSQRAIINGKKCEPNVFERGVFDPSFIRNRPYLDEIIQNRQNWMKNRKRKPRFYYIKSES